jgi:hypothetical protein
LSTSNDNSDIPSADDPWELGQEGCDPQWPLEKRLYDANQENWSNPSCYTYEFRYIIFSDPEVLRPIRVSVVDDIVNHVEDVEDPSFTPSPYIPRLAMNEIGCDQGAMFSKLP